MVSSYRTFEADTDHYGTGFSFHSADLGVNLANFDRKVTNFIERAKKEAAADGEAAMKLEAPWTETGAKNRWGRTSTGAARGNLWATPFGDADSGGIYMGHGVRYGVYLEKRWGGRFQIVMPVLIRTGQALMRSLTEMFAQLELDQPDPVVVLAPGGRGTSQGVGERVREAGRRTVKVAVEHYGNKTVYRGKGGRFISRTVGKLLTEGTKATKRTRRTKRS